MIKEKIRRIISNVTSVFRLDYILNITVNCHQSTRKSHFHPTASYRFRFGRNELLNFQNEPSIIMHRIWTISILYQIYVFHIHMNFNTISWSSYSYLKLSWVQLMTWAMSNFKLKKNKIRSSGDYCFISLKALSSWCTSLCSSLPADEMIPKFTAVALT